MPVLLITGGGRGIGRAVTEMAAARGYDVCLSYRRQAEAAEALAATLLASGRRACAVRAEMGVEADIEALFATCDAELGPPDVLVNNAGSGVAVTRPEDLTLVHLQQVFAANLFGAMLCSREMVRRASTANGGRGGGGVIVNVSSISATTGAPNGLTPYAAAKSALETFTVGLAKQVAQDAIRVCAVRPGYIDTEIHADLDMRQAAMDAAARSPAGRMGAAEEVAAAIVWLASPEAAYSTGAILDVRGGL